ncbi:MAG TPA: hypothetical protein VH309_04075 [Elusimicrobiota bacterium]|nr:hypothetical protein [Elusimicrobiota bacterium]
MLPASLVLSLVLAVPGRAAPAAELRHRLYIGSEESRALDTRTLAALIVERVHRECDLAEASSSGESVLGDDAAMIMMVPPGKFDAIASQGFLNQHQTRTTGGQHRESDRFEAEQELAMLRLPFGAKGRELLPKYAVLDAKNDGLGTYRLPTQYGSVAVVFKKEVSARATWTYADSLDYSRKTGRFDAGGAGNPVLARTFLYERKKGDRDRCGNYCEAQIWGKLTLDDVDYVMIKSSEPVPRAVAERGIPVYDYSVPDSTSAVVDPSRTAQYVRGALRHASEAAAAAGSAPSKTGTRGGFSPRQRLTGELAERPKSPAAARALEDAFASADDGTRALALYGLSELPWERFKPFLLEGLGAEPGSLLISAVAFAADHRGDADVAARLDRLRRAPASVATEWLERLDEPLLCSPR